MVQTSVMVALMAALHQTSRELDPKKLEIVWRVQYALATVILIGLTFYRFVKLQ